MKVVVGVIPVVQGTLVGTLVEIQEVTVEKDALSSGMATAPEQIIIALSIMENQLADLT